MTMDANAIPPLVRLLTSEDTDIQHRACEALRNICWALPRAHAQVLKANAIPSLVSLLASTTPEIQSTAAKTLEKISQYGPAKIALEEAVPAMRQLKSSETNAEAQQSARIFLDNIC